MTGTMGRASTDDRGARFHEAKQWADMDRWHAEVARIRATEPVLHVDDPGFTELWLLTRHADVFAVSRDSARWLPIACSMR